MDKFIIVEISLLDALVTVVIQYVRMEGYNKFLIVLVTVVIQYVRMEGYNKFLIVLVTVVIQNVRMEEYYKFLIVLANVQNHVKMVDFLILIVLVTVLTLFTKDSYVIRF